MVVFLLLNFVSSAELVTFQCDGACEIKENAQLKIYLFFVTKYEWKIVSSFSGVIMKLYTIILSILPFYIRRRNRR